MSKAFDIQSKFGKYDIEFNNFILNNIDPKNSTQIYLIDDYFKGSHLLQHINDNLIIYISCQEDKKSLETIIDVCKKLKEINVTRQHHVIAIGGGVLQDIATFVTSVYMRGLSWTLYPTTLLSMVDSCIGGKSSLNLGSFKNLIGNFNPPAKIIINTKFLATLTQNQLIDGLCEAAKITYVKSWTAYLKYFNLINKNRITLIDYEKIIYLSLTSKKWFIEIDEFDKKERLLLNFGHTFGHALESISQYKISHGAAVGIGMLVADNFYTNYLSKNRIKSENFLHFSSHITMLLMHYRNIKNILKSVSLHDVATKFKADKKHTNNYYKIITTNNKSSHVEMVNILKTEKSDSMILNSYRYIFKNLINGKI